MDIYEETHSSVIGVQTVPDNETHRYRLLNIRFKRDVDSG
jgi:UTP--glucose-1-phosphate uridylyltransferase